ncbi:MAG: 3-dehydroquinate synthase [Clostridiales bacterium]|nr:3-dehydroquinate synthase [Clostridiales bacterium]MCF8021136.1 3-dehydroquinate synthase [Clostridiales bacterium]
MNKVDIKLGRRSYEIITGPGLLSRAGEYLNELGLGKKVLLVSNAQVYKLYGEILKNSLQNSGFTTAAAIVLDGEEYKNLWEAEKLYNAAFGAGLDRNCPVLALGGGVIGDLAGFVASTYMRGVPLVQVPTTLLAQVDSSVGGKVAVNHPRGKNIIGSFYQPGIVTADLNVLESLPERELKAGMAEVIKYGIIYDASFFAWLEENMDYLLNMDYEALAYAVEKSCRIKARVVEEDETEKGMRAILNFGHTVGHALEALTEYKTYRHGEAVAIGMTAAARLAENMNFLSSSDRERIIELLLKAKLPVEIPTGLNREQLINCFYQDKKSASGKLTFVLPVKIGQVEIVKDIKEENLLFNQVSAHNEV